MGEMVILFLSPVFFGCCWISLVLNGFECFFFCGGALFSCGFFLLGRRSPSFGYVHNPPPKNRRVKKTRGRSGSDLEACSGAGPAGWDVHIIPPQKSRKITDSMVPLKGGIRWFPEGRCWPGYFFSQSVVLNPEYQCWISNTQYCASHGVQTGPLCTVDPLFLLTCFHLGFGWQVRKKTWATCKTSCSNNSKWSNGIYFSCGVFFCWWGLVFFVLEWHVKLSLFPGFPGRVKYLSFPILSETQDVSNPWSKLFQEKSLENG